MKYIITAGQKFTDIDAYACACAYAELLILKGIDAAVVLPGPLNHSVTQSIRAWPVVVPVAAELQDNADGFIPVDVSEPEHIAHCVDLSRVVEIFDHHFGFEQYWQERLGDKSHIEIVGACATLIWEAYVREGKANEISAASANLLAVAIVSNSLNFNAAVTSPRDREALRQLESFMSLPPGWVANYFQEQEQYIFANIADAIAGDTKVQEIKNIGTVFAIGQIELWNSRVFIESYQKDIERTLQGFGNEHWFMTAPSISEGKNYIFTKDAYTKEVLEKSLSIFFVGDVAETARLWMRKEILQQLYKL